MERPDRARRPCSRQNNSSGENIMSLKQGSARRLSLLAGSSLVAASLSLLAFGVVAVTPGPAHAFDECTPTNPPTTMSDGPGGTADVTLNGTTADAFTCTGTIPSIAYPSTSGNLTLNLQWPLTVSGGISITPNGTNAVTVGRIAESVPGSGDPTIGNSAGAAINIDRSTNASTGGGITINLNDNDTGDGMITVSGTTSAIRTRNAGTGVTNISLDGAVSASAGYGVDAATSGTGAINVNVGRETLTGSAGAISISSGAVVSIQVNNSVNSGLVGKMVGVVSLNNTGNTMLSNPGEWRFGGTSALHNATALTGTVTVNNTGFITTTALSSTIDFGQATGVLNNGGRLVVGDVAGAATLTLSGVDTWANTGYVVFGGTFEGETDGEANDRIVLVNSTAATFTGSNVSTVIMDVDFSASQASCVAAITADCLDLRGHNTAGTTSVVVNAVATGFAAERIVLVDVAGSGTDAGAFLLSEDSPGYRALGDGMVDAGLFLYGLTHDTAAKQHVLTVVAVDEEAVEINLAARAASAPWDTVTGSWFDRQADLRTSLRNRDEGGISPGAWLRIAGAFAQQDMVSTLAMGPDSVDVLTGHTQDTVALVGGLDLVGAVDDASAWVAGVTFGQANSELGFTQSPNSMEFDGHSLGAYASYVSDGLFVDAIVNTTKLDATYRGASLGMILEGQAESLGYRVDGGWRFDWGDGIAFEPLVAVSHVETDIGDIAIAPGVAAEFDSMTSLRGSLGARLSGDVEFDSFSIQLAGTGRVWKEFDGEAVSRISTGFGDFDFLDAPEDTTGELGLSLGLFGMDGRLSAQVGTGVKFREDYQSVDVSLGARYQW